MTTVQKSFSELITFTRNSSATYVNSSGYITSTPVINYLGYSNQFDNALWTKSNSFVQTNLLTYSEQFDNAAWVTISANTIATANTTIAPDGTLTGDTLASDAVTSQHFAFQSPSLAATTTYTYSIYAKTASTQFLQITTNLTAGSANHYATFDLTAGTVSQVGSSANASIQSVGNGWYRCICTMTTVSASAATTAIFCVVPTGTGGRNPSYTGSTSVYVWGAQLVQGSVPGDYRATTTTALPILYTGPTGALDARKLCENAANTQHYWSEVSAVTAGTAYTVSFRAKAAEKTQVVYSWNSAGGTFDNGNTTFNLSAGTFVASGAATGTMTALGNGWYLCTSTNACLVSSASSASYFSFTALTTYTGDGSSGVYISDAQLEPGSSAGPYYDNPTGSAIYAPRFDYDPVTRAARGLLIEEQRKNLIVRSNDWSASWAITNVTQTPATAIGPDGTMSMTKIAATTSAVTLCAQSSIAEATSQTWSIYAKQGSGPTDANRFAVYNNTTLTNVGNVIFDYSTGAVTQTVGTGAYAVNVGNGIWRIVIPVTSGITVGDSVAGYFGFVGAPETAGEYAYAYGGQMEAGAFATSYIPTTTTQVTRAADVASVSALSPWYSALVGTLYVEFTPFAPSPVGGNSRIVEFNNGTILTRALLYGTPPLSGNGLNFQVRDAGVDQTGLAYPSVYVIGTTLKSAAVMKANDFAFSVNGATPVTDAVGTLPTFSEFNIAAVRSGSTEPLNGWLRRITYYPSRLTNAQLQSITT